MIEDHKTIDKNSNLRILSKHSKCERKLTRFITKNSNEISTIDYAICSKMLSKNIIKVSINDQKVRQNRLEYNPNRKRKKINNETIPTPRQIKYKWKINYNTNWITYKSKN